jgi:hypothetical protein
MDTKLTLNPAMSNLKTDYNFKKWKGRIHSIIDIVRLFYQSWIDLTKKRNEYQLALVEFDAKHTSFNEERENAEMLADRIFAIAKVVIVLILDYLLLKNTILIFGDRNGWPAWWTYAIPTIFIVAEFVVCFRIWKRVTERHEATWFDSFCQYLIIVILLGATVYSIVYDIGGYIPEVDAVSFTTYLTGSVVMQSCIFIFSAILHIVLIQNVPKIAEALMYFLYSAKRGILNDKINRTDRKLARVNASFDKKSNLLILEIYEFDRNYPREKDVFITVLEQDIIDEINKRMGKKVL